MDPELFYELKGCEKSWKNVITGEVVCSLRQDCCKYIEVCPLAYKKEKVAK